MEAELDAARSQAAKKEAERAARLPPVAKPGIPKVPNGKLKGKQKAQAQSKVPISAQLPPPRQHETQSSSQSQGSVPVHRPLLPLTREVRESLLDKDCNIQPKWDEWLG